MDLQNHHGRTSLLEPLLLWGGTTLLAVGLTALVTRWGTAGGLLPPLLAVAFIFLPVFVLDRTGRPYKRYGLLVTSPLKDLPVLVLVGTVAFLPIAFVVLTWPQIWGVSERLWRMTLPPSFISLVVTQLVVVALPEEFFYRGYLQGRLDDRFLGRVRILGVKMGAGTLVGALLFALGHFAVDFQVARLLVFFPALLFSWLRLRQGNVVAPVLFHAASNLFMAILRAGYGL